MTAPFAFVPRSVSKYTTPWEGISRPPPSPSPPPDTTTNSESDNESAPSSLDKAKGKEKALEPPHPKQSALVQDIASLIALALSDYTIWYDTDLRWKLDTSLSDETTDRAGFVPINYLLRRVPFHGALPTEPSETEVVKALRAHAGEILEVRMRLPSLSAASSSSVWYGTGKTSRKKDVGGYEVRRRDWATLRDRPSRGWTGVRWDAMTVYMECIPPQYRTVGGLARFAEALLLSLAEAETNTSPRLRVQAVTLPLHYLDKPGDTPKCKGYALITYSTPSDVEAVLRGWPWKRRPAPEDGDDASPAVREAHKYGLRTISKARWDALNEEYLLYRQSLVDAMAKTQDGMHHPDEDGPVDASEPTPDAQTQTETQTLTTLSSPYPFDCLVFVRNVHPNTNKTTLKSLFAQAFQSNESVQAQGQVHAAAGLDYVDFTKGMDTCYIRLASPRHATRLIAFFDTRPIAQADGLDATGRTPSGDDKPIAIERIQDKREQLYWDKVPEKVRRQAVDRAVQAQSAPTNVASYEPPMTHHGSRQKKRKRECRDSA